MNTPKTKLAVLADAWRMDAHARRRRKYEAADREYRAEIEILAGLAKQTAGLVLEALNRRAAGTVAAGAP